MPNRFEIDLGNTVGIKRLLSEKNRISLPRDITEDLDIAPGELVEIFHIENGIFIRKREGR